MSNKGREKPDRQEEKLPQRGNLSRRKLFQAAAAVAPLGLAGAAGADLLGTRPLDGPQLGAFGPRLANSSISKSLRERAAQMVLFDTHEHIMREELRLKSKTDVFTLLSHYTDADMVSAGMSPEGVDRLQNQDLPIEQRWKELAPYWAHIRTTGYSRCMLIAARDLFGVEDINEQTYRTLSERMAAANRPGWYETVLKEKARIECSVLDDIEATEGEPLHPDPRFFKLVARFDFIVTAGQHKDLEHIEKMTGVAVHSLTDMEKALETAVEKRLQEGAVGFKSGLAFYRTLALDEVTRADAERAFQNLFGSATGDSALAASRKTLSDYLMFKLVQHAAERNLPVQIHTGMMAGSRNDVARTRPSHLINLLLKYREVRFDLFHGSYPYTSELASLAKSLPNVYPDLCWLHIIAPGQARKLLSELIETVPANKILGFGGDFIPVEAVHGHAQIARAVTADVLAEKVEQGYLREREAFNLLERILHQNGKDFFASR